MPKSKISELAKAQKENNDEFYTSYEDIEKEVINYKEQFKNKIILCNCDDPEQSNFWKFFYDNFKSFQLKKLISTHYVKSGSTYAMIYDGVEDKKIPLVKKGGTSLFDMYTTQESNGDFRAEECIEYLKEADIVVTNPPFSLFREFVSILMKYNKQFLILGNMNAITYKEIFPLIKENKMWYGETIHSGDREFRVPDNYPLNALISRVDESGNKYIRVKGIRWFTNIDTNKKREGITFRKKYNEDDYPKYDNYDAINVDKTKDIPGDYYGVMGVPITFLDKYNPEQFEIVNMSSMAPYSSTAWTEINGVPKYARYYIRRRYDNDGNPIK